MNENIIKKIPVSIIAFCVVILTSVFSYAVLVGESKINIWGIEIDPKIIDINLIQPSQSVNLPVGSVISSFLTPKQINEITNVEWVLADGTGISTSSKLFKITGKIKLPDLRGMFIRGLNVSKKTGEQRDFDGNARVVGDYQTDLIKKHKHKYKSAARKEVSGKGSSSPFAWNTDTYTTEYNINGGSETRPKNIALYYYIKIN